MDEGSESYMNFQSERGGDKSGGERVVESISLLERRIYVGQYMWCNLRGAIMCGAIYVVQSIDLTIELSSPLLEQTSHPPTRNLVARPLQTATAITPWGGQIFQNLG